MASILNLLVNFSPIFLYQIGLDRYQAARQNEALGMGFSLYEGNLAAIDIKAKFGLQNSAFSSLKHCKMAAKVIFSL